MTLRAVGRLVVVVGGFALLAGGLGGASNMGFKFTPDIPPNRALDLSLPWWNSYHRAADLLTGLPGVVRVARFNRNATLTNWTATSSPAENFSISKGMAVIAYAGASGSHTAVVYGSHDPEFQFSFIANEAQNVAPPYHQQLRTAKELLTSLNLQLGAGAIGRIAKFEPNSTLTSWCDTCPPSANFNLDLGLGVVVFPSRTVSGYVWPHY